MTLLRSLGQDVLLEDQKRHLPELKNGIFYILFSSEKIHTSI